MLSFGATTIADPMLTNSALGNVCCRIIQQQVHQAGVLGNVIAHDLKLLPPFNWKQARVLIQVLQARRSMGITPQGPFC